MIMEPTLSISAYFRNPFRKCFARAGAFYFAFPLAGTARCRWLILAHVGRCTGRQGHAFGGWTLLASVFTFDLKFEHTKPLNLTPQLLMTARTTARHCLPVQRPLTETIDRFGRLWSYPALSGMASARFSTRLFKAWARVNLDTRAITLASSLKEDPARLEQVLCHELAHIVAYSLVGRSERPHGPTWQRLVTKAGYTPVVRLPESTANKCGLYRQSHGPAPRFLHGCPVCDFSRVARRPMKSWRCADCVAAGLDGLLIVTPQRGVK